MLIFFCIVSKAGAFTEREEKNLCDIKIKGSSTVSVFKHTRMICFSMGRTSEHTSTAKHSMHVCKPTTTPHGPDPAPPPPAVPAGSAMAQAGLLWLSGCLGTSLVWKGLVPFAPTSQLSSSLLLGVSLLRKQFRLEKAHWVGAVPCARLPGRT